MNSSGMLETWVESNILGPKAAEKVLAGKSGHPSTQVITTGYVAYFNATTT